MQETFGIKNYKIYVAGESYAGRYISYVSDAMIQSKNEELYNLTGALLYDPTIGSYDYAQEAIVTWPYVEKHRDFFTFNRTFMATLEELHRDCGYEDYLTQYMAFPPSGPQPALYTPYNTSGGNELCDIFSVAHAAAFQANPCFNVYAINEQCPLKFDPLSWPTDLEFNYPYFDGPYFNRTAVKQAMHAPVDVNWKECSGPVFVRDASGNNGPYGNGDHSLDPIQKVLPRVIEATNRVLIANGNFDFIIMTEGTLLAIQNMTWNGQLGFQEEPETETVIPLRDLQWGPVFEAQGYGDYVFPDQGVMGTHHYERGELVWLKQLF
jgi:carboxypeptidase D